MADIYGARLLTGGINETLDNLDGATLTVNDIAFTVDVTGTPPTLYVHRLTSGGAAESSPEIIVPDTNPGSLNWELVIALRIANRGQANLLEMLQVYLKDAANAYSWRNI